MTDEELFYAWLDGELEAEEAARVATRVAADPALKAAAERHRTLAAFSDASAAWRAKAAAVSLATAICAAMAATLAIGIVAGQFVGDRSTAPVESRDGTLVAAASLDRALDVQLASAGSSGPVRIGLTFRDRQGNICRSFSQASASGLACRKDEDWRVEGLFGASASQQGDYRMASGEDPRLAALIDERIAGEPFDAVAEKTSLGRGWR